MYVTTSVSNASTDDLIQTKPLSIPNTMKKLDTAVNVDEKPQYFSIPRKHNHSATAPRANNNFSDQVQLGSDPLQF